MAHSPQLPESNFDYSIHCRGDLAIEYRLILTLKRNRNNPRRHSRKQIRQIAASIRIFGFNVPILITAEGLVVAGHGRLLAAEFLGLNAVPVIVLNHLTDRQLQAFVIADNKLTENATWDERLLTEQFKALAAVELDFSLEVTGFEVPEIDAMIEGASLVKKGADDPADVIPAEENKARVSAPGSLWSLGKNRVLCADATDPSSYAELTQGLKAAAIVSDPPYNVHIDGHATGLGKARHAEFPMASGEMSPAEFTNFLANALTAMAANCIDGAIGYVWMDWRHLRELLAAIERSKLELKNLCVWVKDNAGMGSFYRSQHELVFVLKNGKASHRNNVQLGQFGRYRTNVWEYPGANSFSRNTEEGNLLALHPTVKPVAMIADAILDCSARGDIILDGFLGSGTTVIAAERTGRVCYGLELDPAYVDTIVRRWQAFTDKSAVHIQSGRTFNDIEAEVTNG
jgi:DNA modification methylase